MDETARVPVKSSWASKINWTQALCIGSTIAVTAGCKACELDNGTTLAIVTTIQFVQGVATFVFRTWFNNSVSPASLGQ